MATPRVAAGALITDGGSRLLMVRPTYKNGWDIPGGYVEPGESPADACARELKEEIGLDRPMGRLLVVDWAPHITEGDKLLFIFDGGQMTDAEVQSLVVDGDEIAEATFQAIDSAFHLTPDRLARRLRVAFDAARAGAGVYAEHGVTR